jgi:GntR family transcriptional regulator / MocR family aminotransferase
MKRPTTFELALPLRESDTPAYLWLYEGLRAAILAGRLRPGVRLPATRDLANQYGLSRGTIVYAFDQLKAEGYLEGSIGSGTYVSGTLPEDLLHAAPFAGSRLETRRAASRPVSDYARRVKLFPGYEKRPSRAFRSNLPALDLFPTSLWTKIATRRLRNASTFLLMGCDPLGYVPLREAIADYLNTFRGVKCDPEQVLIVSGVQEALDLTARLLLNGGDIVCMENPGYPGARIAFEAVGARVHSVTVDNDGMLLMYSKLGGSRLVYVTPGHQFPCGITMSLSRRLELLEWARKSGALIFEDDYDSEFRYSGRPVPAMQGLDSHGSVLFAGSFSKVLFPSLRLGYLVVPPDLLDSFAATKSVTSRHAPLLEQAILCDFITDGHFSRHIRRMREVYAERLSVLIEEAQKKLSDFVEISKIEAGLQTTGWLRDPMDAEFLAQLAAEQNVEVTPLSRYYRGHMKRQGLQLGFAAIDAREIRRGIRDLAVACQKAF